MRARFPWGLTLAVVPLLVLLVGLGVWQVQRLHWKEALIAAAGAAADKPPVPLAQVLAGPDIEFRRAIIVCRGLATAPYVELQSIHDGQAGVRLVSACRPEGQPASLLVDRGFVSADVSARPRVTPSTLPLVMIGELRRVPPPGRMAPEPSNGHFYARDTAAMAVALKATGPVRPEVAFAITATNPEIRALQPSAPPAAFSNNHLGYAITWFGLALVLVGFYIALARRKLST